MLTNFETDIEDEKRNKIRVSFFLLRALNTPAKNGPTFEDIEIRTPLCKIVRETADDAEFEFTPEQLIQMRDVYSNTPPISMHEDVLTIKRTLEAAAAKPPKSKDKD